MRQTQAPKHSESSFFVLTSTLKPSTTGFPEVKLPQILQKTANCRLSINHQTCNERF
jgi:hypothetical protein